MNCPSCKVKMELRTGKYGDFYYCRDHGTISKKAAAILTGQERPPPSHYAYAPSPNIDLLEEVHRMSVAFGGPVGETAELLNFLTDASVEYATSGDEEDEEHWTNLRPY